MFAKMAATLSGFQYAQGLTDWALGNMSDWQFKTMIFKYMFLGLTIF